MTRPAPFRIGIMHAPACLCVLAAVLTAQTIPIARSQPQVLDRAVAVVNKHVILLSDLDDEIRLSILDPNNGAKGPLTRRQALDQLISRTLIQQQIREQDAQAVAPSQQEVNARLKEIRTELPACVHQDCASDTAWNAFLAQRGLSPGRVEAYLRYRLEILRFIEQRFRQGIQISPEQIQTYYQSTLVPQYSAGETIAPLQQVAPRIQEILLQQQVNVLFDNWLTNLRQQGDVEVLDPSLDANLAAAPPSPAAGTAEKGAP